MLHVRAKLMAWAGDFGLLTQKKMNENETEILKKRKEIIMHARDSADVPAATEKKYKSATGVNGKIADAAESAQQNHKRYK